MDAGIYSLRANQLTSLLEAGVNFFFPFLMYHQRLFYLLPLVFLLHIPTSSQHMFMFACFYLFCSGANVRAILEPIATNRQAFLVTCSLKETPVDFHLILTPSLFILTKFLLILSYFVLLFVRICSFLVCMYYLFIEKIARRPYNLTPPVPKTKATRDDGVFIHPGMTFITLAFCSDSFIPNSYMYVCMC